MFYEKITYKNCCTPLIAPVFCAIFNSAAGISVEGNVCGAFPQKLCILVLVFEEAGVRFLADGRLSPRLKRIDGADQIQVQIFGKNLFQIGHIVAERMVVSAVFGIEEKPAVPLAHHSAVIIAQKEHRTF